MIKNQTPLYMRSDLNQQVSGIGSDGVISWGSTFSHINDTDTFITINRIGGDSSPFISSHVGHSKKTLNKGLLLNNGLLYYILSKIGGVEGVGDVG